MFLVGFTKQFFLGGGDLHSLLGLRMETVIVMYLTLSTAIKIKGEKMNLTKEERGRSEVPQKN